MTALRVLQVVLNVAGNVFSAAVICKIVFTWMGVSREPALTIQREMRPFVPFIAVSQPVLVAILDRVPPDFWACLNLSAAMFLWWATGRDDDGRWKRRRKKLAAKVASVGGRLQVVPVVNR